MRSVERSGTFQLGDLRVRRLGYGAMHLSGAGVFGPPQDRDAALAVLREAVAAGVNHIDTSDYYGPHITNQLIREALHPYPDDLVIVTKVGARRGADASWLPAFSPAELTQAVDDNLRNLGIVCVQNMYNVTHRADDALIDDLAREEIAYVPFFPLGGFTPMQSSTLSSVALRLGATPMQVALAWLLRRAPNILPIPGTSSVTHLRENLAAAELDLPDDAVAALDGIAAGVAA